MGALVTIYGQQTEAQADVVIPKEAVRLRILANSDAAEDQALKRAVRDAVNAQITTWVKDLKSFTEAREVIQAHLPEIEQTVERVLQEKQSDQSYRVEFRRVAFPTKIYGKYVYPAGEYEAVLITLGAGEGANWWCVLFPPLCFLDFSSGEAVSMEETKADAIRMEDTNLDAIRMEKTNADAIEVVNDEQPVEVKFFVVEVWKKVMP
jgi:stage II sporulation protein R